MLSIEKCRKHLDGLELTDKQVDEVRGFLYHTVNNIPDNSYEKEATKSTE